MLTTTYVLIVTLSAILASFGAVAVALIFAGVAALLVFWPQLRS